MRITGQLYDKMKYNVKKVVDHYGGPQKINTIYLNLPRTRKLWDIWHITHDNLHLPDNHPVFRKNKRILPYENFNIYSVSDTLTDVHIESALKQIGYEIGI